MNAPFDRIRSAPFSIAIAIIVATVAISTAFFFASWRLTIDAHQHFLGSPASVLGALAFIFISVFYVLPVMIAVLGLCLDRCVAWWHGVLAFLIAIGATIAVVASPSLRSVLPVALLGEGTNSSERWYSGAIVQLIIAFFLLRYFRRSPKSRSRGEA